MYKILIKTIGFFLFFIHFISFLYFVRIIDADKKDGIKFTTQILYTYYILQQLHVVAQNVAYLRELFLLKQLKSFFFLFVYPSFGKNNFPLVQQNSLKQRKFLAGENCF